MNKKILVIIGTRPEAIKMAPVILALQSNSQFYVKVFCSRQHVELMQGVLEVFGISADFFGDSMVKGQSLECLSARIISGISPVLFEFSPDLVLVHGDTSTAFIGAYCAFLRGIPIGHVEAGLRTTNLFLPFPEEGNRRLISQLASLHFPPTVAAAANLLKLGIPSQDILVTGNTVVDSLLFVRDQLNLGRLRSGLSEIISLNDDFTYLTITLHRRENLGENLVGICNAFERLATTFPKLRFVWPVHKNPVVFDYVFERFNGNESFYLIEPLGYVEFVDLLSASFIAITDSGGIQEEVPSLNVPVVVLRDETERPEVVEAGAAILVGSNSEEIFRAVEKLLFDRSVYARMASAVNPFGSGLAAKAILNRVEQFLLRLT